MPVQRTSQTPSVVVFDDIDFLIKMVQNNDKERNNAPQLPT
jgi:hypothetical protein